MTFKSFFHIISYLQYPLMLIGLYFVFRLNFMEVEQLRENQSLLFSSLNSAMIFSGLAISFSSLQDTTKTQNNFSKRIWEDPLKGKITIIIMSCLILFIVIYGLFGYFIAENGVIKDLAIGAIILGLGMFGFLKAAMEMFENHRKDKNTSVDNS